MWGTGGRRRRRVGTVLAVTALATTLVPVGVAQAAPCAAGTVALTFDDGPSPSHTPAVLDQLRAHGAVATFFVIGSRVGSQPATVRRMEREGHAVANHTWNHENLTRLSNAGIRSTLDRTDRAIRATGVRSTRLLRPPYGATDSRVRSTVRAAGYGHITWTVDPRDWERSSSQISSFVLNNLRNGAVILLHDGTANAGQTRAALPTILRGITGRGYCYGLLDDAGRIVPPQPPEIDWREFGGPYRDVKPTSTHGPAITELKRRGVTTGCGDGRYCPDADVTREQMATFLVRAFGLPAVGGHTYRDVSSVHAANVQALTAAGVTIGCDARDPTRFCGSDPVTRQQMATFLARVLELPPGTARFRDVDPTATHGPQIAALADAGITRGCDPPANQHFCPRDRVTRGQMASFLVRALERTG
jgi:peptidoglycan-N-acetylglucosamine deacetylase